MFKVGITVHEIIKLYKKFLVEFSNKSNFINLFHFTKNIQITVGLKLTK